MTEDEFLKKLWHFPHSDLQAALRLADEACTISSEAAFRVVHEISHPWTKTPSTQGLTIVERVAAQLVHPLALMILDLARRSIRGEHATEAEALTAMREISEYPKQYGALSIAYYSCGPSVEVEPEKQRILRTWMSARSPTDYACLSCEHEFAIEVTEYELHHTLDPDRTEACPRCAQRIGKGPVTCRTCGNGFVLDHLHWHVSCNLCNGDCPACGANYMSPCIC